MLQLLCAGPVNLHDSRLVVALDSHIPENDDIRLQARTRGLLDIQTFWHYFPRNVHALIHPSCHEIA